MKKCVAFILLVLLLSGCVTLSKGEEPRATFYLGKFGEECEFFKDIEWPKNPRWDI